jgi:PncC family amidohydrolase
MERGKIFNHSSEQIGAGLEESLEIQVGYWLRRRQMKLVAAESCTGGLVGHLITNVPGSSDYYLGSITAYAYEAKERLLGVRHDTLATYGAVSEQVVLEMARGARRVLAADFDENSLIGVSISGIAGPGGGMPGKPVGLVWIGLSAPGLERAWKYVWTGDRVENKQLSAVQVLRLVMDYLQGKITV